MSKLMKKVTFLILIALLGFQDMNVQKTSKADYSQMIKLEGMEYSGGITFYIEKNSEILIAVQNDSIKWKADVIKNCRKRKAKITSVSIRSERLKVLFGKNKIAFVTIENGETECVTDEKVRQTF
ncbi:hypothetical protein FLA105534_00186 [Flavobacterium bizetiae]|uniref:Uncharacterized protein n=2 Tax=Flavobacterium bizetiae TaxID=2704140 RepID=A0A6J4G6P6_9FLAO|nr:hypothetical protein FLA105534_00186 [Flavobacterium bizetiae]CAD5340131.1 hypothetical protein FLA105535_00085 [Flavobacterium bizetiae]CAD5346198.1 hypothetical protein FLA105534_00139 [Flavobacterium bizetiae]